MTDLCIPINRKGGVVIGYRVSEHRSVYLRSEMLSWFQSGTSTPHTYPDRKSASAAFRKALKRGSCSASMQAVVIPERLWP
jgi:hypothetical protein